MLFSWTHSRDWDCALHLGVIVIYSFREYCWTDTHFSIKAETISHIKWYRRKCLRVKTCLSWVLHWKKKQHIKGEGLCCSTAGDTKQMSGVFFGGIFFKCSPIMSVKCTLRFPPSPLNEAVNWCWINNKAYVSRSFLSGFFKGGSLNCFCGIIASAALFTQIVDIYETAGLSTFPLI